MATQYDQDGTEMLPHYSRTIGYAIRNNITGRFYPPDGKLPSFDPADARIFPSGESAADYLNTRMFAFEKNRRRFHVVRIESIPNVERW